MRLLKQTNSITKKLLVKVGLESAPKRKRESHPVIVQLPLFLSKSKLPAPFLSVVCRLMVLFCVNTTRTCSTEVKSATVVPEVVVTLVIVFSLFVVLFDLNHRPAPTVGANICPATVASLEVASYINQDFNSMQTTANPCGSVLTSRLRTSVSVSKLIG
jgi:hypothetical protein